MNHLKISFTSLFFFLALSLLAQQNNTSKTKKASKATIKAHRGTILTNVHEKVSGKANLKYTSLPRVGFETIAVPAGAITVTDSLNTYSYKAGIFYVQRPTGFVITLPVAGIRLKGLPIGYRIVHAAEKTYFYYYGTFYKQVENSDNYETVTPPETAIVDGLPNGYAIKKVDGVEYYFLNGTYYAEVDDPTLPDKIGYEVVVIIEEY
ncbi:MAG: DUF6515 family protein [Chitinophagaceae bacterium]